MDKNTYKAHLALLAANFIYGINHLIAKGIMPHKIHPSALVFLRILIAGSMFWIIKSFIKEKVAKKDLWILLLCGLFGVFTNMLLFFHGLSLTSPIDASIIMTSVPVIVLILGAIFLKERITNNKIFGIAIGAVGAVILILFNKKSGGTSSVLGNTLVFINACSYASYLVMVKPLMKKYNPITVVSWAFLFGFIFMIPFGLNKVVETNFSDFTFHTYLSVAFVIIGTTFLAYLFNIYALTKVSPSVSGSYIYLQPAISFVAVTIYAYFLGHTEYIQDINLIKILSCLLVIFGVYLISKKPKTALN